MIATQKMFCSFCSSKDHFVRTSKDPKSNVICPALLSTQCTEDGCGEFGHTRSYCPLRAKKLIEKRASQKEAAWKAALERRAAIERGEFVTKSAAGLAPRRNIEEFNKMILNNFTTKPIEKKLNSRFAALDMSSSEDELVPSDDELDATEVKNSVTLHVQVPSSDDEQTSFSWAQRVKHGPPAPKPPPLPKRPTGMSWADWEEEDDDQIQ